MRLLTCSGIAVPPGADKLPGRPRDHDREGWIPAPSRNRTECYISRAEFRMYAGTPSSASDIKARLKCEAAGPVAGAVATSSWAAPKQTMSRSADCSPVDASNASSAVQSDSQGAPSSLAGATGSLPQSWESGAGRVGAAARQRQIPDPTKSHAISTAVSGLVRTGSSLGQITGLSSATGGMPASTPRRAATRRNPPDRNS